jgi:uncharacterized membrane-anchored protein
MKTNSLVLALGLTLAVAPAAFAGDNGKAKDDQQAKPPVATDQAKQPQSQSDVEQGKTALTGSYIKKDIRRNGYITDGSSQVLVIDRNMIDQSGASDLKQVLIRRGIH